MNALPLVILAVMLSLGMQPPPKNTSTTTPSQPPAPKKDTTAKTIDIEIVVGPKLKLDERCKGGPPASTVFVVSAKEVYHCVGNVLHNHDNHLNVPEMDKAAARAFAGDIIRWYSNTNDFTVVSVTKPKNPKLAPQNPKAPATPFTSFTNKTPREVFSTPVPRISEKGVVVQRYKATFKIADIGLVDPDLICSM